MTGGNIYPNLAKQLLFLYHWRPSRRDIRICFRSMYFTGSMFSEPSALYYRTDPEYISMDAVDKHAFERSMERSSKVPHVNIRHTQIILDYKYIINVPMCRFSMLRELYLAHNLANITHMHMCITHVFVAYKFCKNYLMLLLTKYPYISRVIKTTAAYYSLYDIDIYFGSKGAFTHAADTSGKTIYMPIAEIAKHLKNCCVVVPDVNGKSSVELSDGRRIFKIYLSNIEYIPTNATEDDKTAS